MSHALYVILSIIWIYFFGWVFLGNVFSKVLPKVGGTVARIIGAVIGFLTAGTVIAFLL
jgi:hypothetical protein